MSIFQINLFMSSLMCYRFWGNLKVCLYWCRYVLGKKALNIDKKSKSAYNVLYIRVMYDNKIQIKRGSFYAAG